MKTRDEIQAAIDAVRGVQGFAADDDGAADKVLACCAGYESVLSSPDPSSPIWLLKLIPLALEIIPIIFGEGGFTIEKLQAVLSLLLNIFTP